jgi:hypothetical protein
VLIVGNFGNPFYTGIENKLYIGDLNSGVYLLQAINKDGKVEVRKMIRWP